jgi:hypothetical protein
MGPRGASLSLSTTEALSVPVTGPSGLRHYWRGPARKQSVPAAGQHGPAVPVNPRPPHPVANAARQTIRGPSPGEAPAGPREPLPRLITKLPA